uniref:Pre-mRNA processing factor 4 (PRP4)-like domain-containing protein n=1 Tax=Panagrolaimus sp. PS1159 TaxID=55785 RepID=A0AC35G0P0_9BILA
MTSLPKKQKIIGSLADKSVVEQIRRDRDNAAAAQNQRLGDMIDIKKVDNPAEKAILAEFDRRRKARTLTLPTDDVQVKLMLRKLNEPICLFGEDILDRRERLRRILSQLGEDDVTRILHSLDRKEPATKSDLPNNKTWYHEGPPELRDGRIFIADYSLPRAQRRLQVALERSKKPTSEKALRRQELHKWIHSLQLHGSQTAGLRAISFCEFSPDSKHIITSAWCGQTTIWSCPDLKKEIQLIGHSDQVGCARFHPLAYKDGASTLTAASCDYGGRALLWAADKEEPLTELEPHGTRVSRLAFHPSGRFLATSWDLRTGKCIMFLEGHQQAIHTVGWHPNGFHMATGSADNSSKIWDIRMRRCIYTIPAHKSLVSRLKIDSEGEYMVTSSFDNNLKIFATNGWQPLKNLEGHSMGVMCADVSLDSKWIASASKDRSLKLWTSSALDIVESI